MRRGDARAAVRANLASSDSTERGEPLRRSAGGRNKRYQTLFRRLGSGLDVPSGFGGAGA